MTEDPQNLPGTGFLGWLGRQIGNVEEAANTDDIRTIIHGYDPADQTFLGNHAASRE